MDVAISAFSGRPTILIAGGKNRNLDLTDTKKRLKSAKNLIKVILIGETAPLLAAEQDPQKFAIAPNLSAAVTLAHQMAKNHLQIISPADSKPVVLMSPGAASFDMFKDFIDRGEKFQQIVKMLK